jgi:sugar transferase (PEP-CTERM/EpsH1 system associated)
MRHEILFLSHRIPFPPDRGDKIRSHHIVKRLARLAPVHVATFADDDSDMAEEVELATLAHSYHLARRLKPLGVAGMQSLISGKPTSLHAFYDRDLATYVEQIVRERPIGTIFVFSGQMGQYVPAGFTGRVIVDLVDVDSAKFEAYSATTGGVIGRIYAREGRLLREEEARLVAGSDHTLLISEAEAALFRSRLPEDVDGGRVGVLRNGVDADFFDPSAVLGEARLEHLPRPRILFTGQMDYPPNVDAVVRAARRIMPLVRLACPEASFHVVGRNPAEEVAALEGVNGTRVWGRVGDVRPWLKGCDIALIPLEIGRGVQNKVLEAMAMGLPVVLSPEAATGIGARDAKHFEVAASDEELARAVNRLAAEPEAALAMGLEARRFVNDRMAWSAALAELSDILSVRRTLLTHAA